MNRCRVSLTDTNGIPYDVEVQAESLYEAVALAVVEFRADKLTAEVGLLWNTGFASTRSRNGLKGRSTVLRESSNGSAS
jgi:hypothetical protein